MRAVDIIIKKRRGMALTDQEIDFFIEGYSQGSIPDYQVSALLMAIYFQGMSDQERAALTMAMVRSGQEIDLSSIQGIKVDKHSTGGVGDTTTLVLAPLVAALGAPVAKMSGRGLGHTGGTIDKFEAIPGFKLELGQEQFIHNVNNIGVAVVAQTGNLTPADKKLYALRDVTGTVESIPLIASSIMSKKIAAGANAIVLDVKTGNGAFMKEEKDAFTLAQAMVDIGELVGRKTVALITDMSQPLGKAIGNSIEVKEAIDTLKGQGPKDLEDLCLNLGAQLLILADKAENEAEAKSKLKDAISSGKAINKLKELIGAQGGDPRVVDNPDLLPQADKIIEVKASSSGYVNSIDSELLGNGAMTLGAGRETKESIIDLAVGISVEKKLGDYVAVGDTLALLHVNDERNLSKVQQMVLSAYSLGVERNEPPKLIYGVVTKEGGF